MFCDDGSYVRHNGNSLDAIMPRKGHEAEYKKYVYDDIERIGSHGGRAFTVTFTDTNLTVYREGYLINRVYFLCQKSRAHIQCRFVPELSATGRFHLHGVVHCKTLAGYSTIQKKLRKEFGIVKVKVIDNTCRWAEYCTKQIKVTATEDNMRT